MGKKWGNYPLELRNYKRLVEVWFDQEYKEYFYTRQPLARFIDHGDISEQIALKEQLKCKSFDWFMREIAYDVFDKFPRLPPNKHWGEIKNYKNGQCIDTYNLAPPGRAGTSGCHGLGGNQLFRLNTKGQLTSGEWCIEFARIIKRNENQLLVSRCKPGTVDGPWSYNESTGLLKHLELSKCVGMHRTTLKLVLTKCDESQKLQKWKFSQIRPVWKTNF